MQDNQRNEKIGMGLAAGGYLLFSFIVEVIIVIAGLVLFFWLF